MATMTYNVSPHCNKRGEHAVSFTLAVSKTRKTFPTGLFVRHSDVSSDGKSIKNHKIVSVLEHKRLEFLDRIYELEVKSLGQRELTAAYVVEKLLAVPHEQEFFAYADRWLERCNLKGKRNYETMLRKLEGYLGKRYLPFINLNYSMLTGFEKYLSKNPRAVSLYLSSLRHVFREAWRELNTDFEKVIHDDPFTRYQVPRQVVKRGVRALPQDDLMKIYHYKGRPHSRAQLARDCFILSFCLMGMNAADLYDCTEYKNNRICYKRVKTRDRRPDEAYIEVEVHPFIDKLMRKYRGSDHVFNFSARYSSPYVFDSAICKGMRELGKEVGIEGLQFYQARHTFATLSRNLMKFAKSDVDEALNHVGGMALADVYIKKDFSIINENNRKLIDEVFKDYM